MTKKSDKGELDERTAWALYHSKAEISHITGEFFNQLAELLLEQRTVTIPGFGRFTLRQTQVKQKAKLRRGSRDESFEVEVTQRIDVHFSKSNLLRQKLKESLDMEKYGVDETGTTDQESLEKIAAKGCPDCGSQIIKQGSVILCPVHGSQPFEQPPPHQGGKHGK